MAPSIIAHRGASGYAWENSPTAFRRAVEMGADGVELDIHTTIDGELVVHHDGTIDGLGPIPRLPVAGVTAHRLPSGDRVPTLSQALELLDGLEVWVEVKTLPPERDEYLFRILDAGPSPESYAVHGFDHRIIARLGERRPSLRRGVLLASYLLDPLPVLTGAGADTLWMDTRLVDSDLVRLMHTNGFDLIAWTANDPAEIGRLVDLGVDGICGNYPDRIRAAVGAAHS
jgi:glycerophosphoryl diester phosphodiesterase